MASADPELLYMYMPQGFRFGRLLMTTFDGYLRLDFIWLVDLSVTVGGKNYLRCCKEHTPESDCQTHSRTQSVQMSGLVHLQSVQTMDWSDW